MSYQDHEMQIRAIKTAIFYRVQHKNIAKRVGLKASRLGELSKDISSITEDERRLLWNGLILPKLKKMNSAYLLA
ncbi:hypothetical protein P255_02958 [Acinetobacter brisouii CIP 110357]|uniref:Uncharacterized protein n=1 Tax=Acinetobacter brisouii CIP 110357 TaxID=1341683 RepID=V2UG37_9GAMM|nr:hypothetical protein [Acinetobacter brisouii]ENV46209.1 hypothetical protein F954_02844 [Acinetobacter brisouii ANC 4119]ESK47476.1 hypothetical protein P255_02958 [Acinetobacter brisouii CIP 110357]